MTINEVGELSTALLITLGMFVVGAYLICVMFGAFNMSRKKENDAKAINKYLLRHLVVYPLVVLAVAGLTVTETVSARMVKERKSKMPFLNRWNYETQKYDPYGVPDDWNVKSYSDDMDEIVNCPHCGKKVTFGSCYTSKEIHTPHGFGYAVCENCYNIERAIENRWRNKQ